MIGFVIQNHNTIQQVHTAYSVLGQLVTSYILLATDSELFSYSYIRIK